jgi:serine protease Do
MKVSGFFVVLALSCLGGCTAADKFALALGSDPLSTPAPVKQARAAKPAFEARPKPKNTQSSNLQPLPSSVSAPVLPAWTIPVERPSKTQRHSLATSELFKRLSPSIYTVSTSRSQGSAVAISLKELVTACHVVAHTRTVTLVNGATTLSADVVGADPATDRCFLRVQDGELKPVPGLRDYSTLSVGEPVFTIGSPRGLANTLGAGLLSGLRVGENNTEYIQITAPLSPGSSGGGVFDDRGNLIGVTSFTVPDSQSLNFAISASQFWR